ncbi:SusD/RagB family nutrient-binding outer membrane lipoprotein [Taibaiella koreensis]|uniref:SusD/RagB family nutrient-binding outer membrane lipoprotein n=1 Tax=Taibaiella koreensis TaxID=1268548 RepID=UPI000E59A311|nr:SusD/RagB family nutrient-binding outer membrane lipoprotein [Taibaiella koreensis]
MKSKVWLLLSAALILITGCRKFEQLNTDPARPEEADPRYLLSSAEKRATDLMYHAYYNGRIGMHCAQYWTGTDKTAESRYLFTDEGLWSGLYSGPLMDLQEISNYYERHPSERNPHMVAVAEILKCWIFHVLTDVYIDIPFSQALQGDANQQPAFDKAQDVYNSLLGSLQGQINVLKETDANAVQGDILGAGDKDYWIRFANALRLRIAMRMADVQPDAARQVIEDAAGNTLTSVSQDVFFPYNGTAASSRFPYNEADRPMVEFAATSTLIDYMKKVNDPRLPVYARPDVNTKMFRGKVYGTADNSPALDSLSKPGALPYSASMKGYIITYAEVAFIKAEAAARGMNVGGNAASLYEDGIKASMEQWGVKTTDTLVANYLKRVPYTAGGWKDVIGTQKWLALYMQGLQAWMERLRLDFRQPDGTPLFIKPASGTLDPLVPDVPQRLNYPVATLSTNAANASAAAQRIGGDTKATRNWWNIQ